MSVFNPKYFEPAKIAELNEQFNSADPFPNIAMDGLLDEAFALKCRENFPTQEQMRRHYEGLNEKKSEGSNFEQYHECFTELRQALGSPEFIKFLEGVTGIDGLLLPNDFRGTGVHQGTNGSFLDVHVDFSVHPELNVHRRLNLLFFLTDDWKEEYGGALELWDAKVKNKVAQYYPNFNRAAMFATSDISYHGYNKISTPEGVFRNSFFTYYYTPITDKSQVKYHDTIFKARPEEGLAKAVKTDVKEGGKNFVKGVLHKLGVKSFFKKFE